MTAASSASNAWVFANQGNNVETAIGLRWNGTSWTDESDFPAWSDVGAAVVIGKADAWAFGQIISPSSPYVAHYNGTTWTQAAWPATVTPVDASALSARNIWAVGQGTGTMAVVHWNGTTWSQVSVPYPTVQPGVITQDGHGGIWLTAYGSANFKPYLYHDNGGDWHRVAVPARKSSSTQLNALSWIPGGRSVWAGGASFPDSNPNGISQAAFLKYGP